MGMRQQGRVYRHGTVGKGKGLWHETGGKGLWE